MPALFAIFILNARHGTREEFEGFKAAPGEAEEGIANLFANPNIETIHAHNAVPGCFSAKIERN
jgi:hypothetical protein